MDMNSVVGKESQTGLQLQIIGTSYEFHRCSRQRIFSDVCLCIRALKGNRLELSTPNSLDIQSMAVARRALTLRSKGQGHALSNVLARCHDYLVDVEGYPIKAVKESGFGYTGGDGPIV